MHFGPFSMVPQRAIEIDGAEDLCSGNSGYLAKNTILINTSLCYEALK